MYIYNGKLDIDKIADDFSGYLWTIVHNAGITESDDIKDIISDTYLILWNNQEKLDVNKNLSPYLIGILKNLIKRYKSKFKKTIIENNIEDYEEILCESEGLDLIIENRDINSAILKILNTMKDEDKEIFENYYFEERKIKEIAIEYNVSESKVKTKLHRLRKKIRKELLKGGYSING
jgi:RNA polymerase sigma-70 factor (ECF subfamily)